MSVADRLHESLAPMHGDAWGADDGSLRALCDAIGGMLEPLDGLLRADGGPWASVADPDTAPADALAWLGQFVGVRVTRGADPAQQRTEIRQASGWRRGTPGAMRAAVAATLTGTQTVILREQYAGAYVIRVETYLGETPDPVATEAAARSQKPAGIVLQYEAVQGANWDAVDGDDWDDLNGQVWDDQAAT